MTLVRWGASSGPLRGIGDRLAGMSAARRWGAGASLVWTVVVVGYAIGFSTSVVGTTRAMLFLDTMFFLVALVLPLLLVWLAVWLAEELERQREVVAALAEVTSPLIDALVATRAALEANVPASPGAIGQVVQAAIMGSRGPDLAPHIDRVLAGQARVEVMLQRLSARSPEAAPPSPPEPAPGLPAAPPKAAPEPAAPPATEAEPTPPSDAAGPDWATLVRALDFPRDADDAQGFEALRAVLRHPGLAQMLQAAEDVLNLLSQEAVYVDELPMARVDPAAWRRFIDGTRGTEVASVGGIHDERALELTRGLMHSDTIFRDTALFFQRRFDAVLAEFASDVDDARLIELASTRSGRAFMLLVRLSGSLD